MLVSPTILAQIRPVGNAFFHTAEAGRKHFDTAGGAV
jgi:hypothetical protein